MKYHNYNKALGLSVYSSNRQADIYFEMITNCPELKSLTGKQMAEVARLMGEQKLYGYNECGKEFQNWDGGTKQI